MTEHARAEILQLDQIGSRKKAQVTKTLLASLDDEISTWLDAYLDLAILGGEKSRDRRQN